MATSQRRPGWSWSDAVLWIGALLGIVLLGLWGDLAVGAVIAGAAALGAAATGITRRRHDTAPRLRPTGSLPGHMNPAPRSGTTAEPSQ
jgi:hypothetical protein